MDSVIVDGSARRFQAQKIYLRAMAAMKWVNRRNAILQGRKPTNGNIALLQQTDNTLRAVSLSSSSTTVFTKRVSRTWQQLQTTE